MQQLHSHRSVESSPTSYTSNKKPNDEFGNFINYTFFWPLGFIWCFISGFSVALFDGEGRADMYL